MDMVDTLLNKPKNNSPNSSQSRRKFLFDTHIFDEPDVEEIPAEPPPPPPPTFSEHQLEAARKAAFEQGRQQGLQEEKASREQKTSELIAVIIADTQTLFAAEIARGKLYEEEAVKLTQAVFGQLFPLYQAHQGFAELKAVLSDIIARQIDQAEVLIEVAPSQKQEVEAHIHSITRPGGKAAFSVQGSESLAEGQCKLSWTHGGALYNAPAMAAEIRSLLEETLANNAGNSHDGSGMTDPSSNSPEPSSDKGQPE